MVLSLGPNYVPKRLYLGISIDIDSQLSTNSFFHIEIRFNSSIDMISMHNYLKARGAVREKCYLTNRENLTSSIMGYVCSYDATNYAH